ncbi:Putative E3 ubiquitin-protein ligase LIN-2 [Linum perenne]
MTSLQQLLAEEGFTRRKKHGHSFRNRVAAAAGDSAFNLKPPIYICREEDEPNFKTSSRRRKDSTEIIPPPPLPDNSTPEMDQIAVRAIVSILSGYVGRYGNDAAFRRSIREKCSSCLVRNLNDENPILTNIELAVRDIDATMFQCGGGTSSKETKLKSLKNSIQLLTIVSSLNSKKSRRNGFATAGIPNSHISSCAQLYLSIVYKLERNDRISAVHLLQTFCDAPLLARTHLLPDLWEHFFLPHLLHLKVWYLEELEILSQSSEKGLKSLCKVYNEQMDIGTVQFALYYKNWLKVGVKAPSVPDVPLPWKQSLARRRTRSSMDSSDSQPSINRSLFDYVFSRTPHRQSKEPNSEDYNDPMIAVSKRRSNCSSVFAAPSDTQKQQYFSCRSMVAECLADGKSAVVVKNDSFRNSLPISNGLRISIIKICTSDVLSECESAIHDIATSWLNSQGDDHRLIEGALSREPVIDSMFEILYASTDEEVLELVVSLLTELVVRRETNRMTVLNYDPQLEIFIKLMKSSSLFLKAAALLYQLRPMAKQMISAEWVALVLRVLEFGDQLQVLFDVKCVPHEAALYLLDQLMTGFDEDKNLENSSQVVALGGLSLLVRRFEIGEFKERNKVARLMCSCVEAVGSCRNYLAENLSLGLLLQLISVGIRKQQQSMEVFGFKLLTELLCLSRRTQIIKVLSGISGGFEGLNAMNIFLVCLQRASPEDRPLVAAVLLQLDLLGDPMKHSVYREEAVEAMIECLDCERCDSEGQEHTARALLMIGGSFSHDEQATSTTTTSTEEWMLQERLDGEEEWQRKLATVLLNSGGRRFLTALSGAIANGTPNLAHASLFTVSWMNKMFLAFGDRNLVPIAHSILMSELVRQRSPSSLQNHIVNDQGWKSKPKPKSKSFVY